jgi:hypothetical protein
MLATVFSKIDHPNGEHDDWANTACGDLLLARELAQRDPAAYEMDDVEREQVHAVWGYLAGEEPGGEFDEPNVWLDDPQARPRQW